MRISYAFSTALISVFPQVGQGEGYSAQLGTVLRRTGGRDPEAMARIARGLGLDGVAPAAAPGRVAEKMEEGFRSLGMPTRLSALGIERGRLAEVLEHSLRNFNADPKRDFVKERDNLAAILEEAW
jgi:alcohol dehydrogenase class IV